MTAAGLATAAPPRGDNARGGKFQTPGTTTANVVQQTWVTDVATRVRAADVQGQAQAVSARLLVARSRRLRSTTRATASDGCTPGINGTTTMAAIRNADDNLRRLREALVGARPARPPPTSSWRPTTASRRCRARAPRARPPSGQYADVVPGHLPPGFVRLGSRQRDHPGDAGEQRHDHRVAIRVRDEERLRVLADRRREARRARAAPPPRRR